jgi:hypothetical protein
LQSAAAVQWKSGTSKPGIRTSFESNTAQKRYLIWVTTQSRLAGWGVRFDIMFLSRHPITLLKHPAKL